MTQPADLRAWLGDIDVYLFDQLLKGRFDSSSAVLDAGCGGGRNLVYMLRSGYEAFAVDRSPEAVARVRALAASLAPALPPENFRAEAVERMSFGDARFGLVVSSAVLHFARDEEHWNAMVDEMWRVLAPGGLLFARLATTIGVEDLVVPVGGGRYALPGGTEWLLVDAATLERKAEALGAEPIEPIKSVVVHGLRSMGVWVLRKRQT